MVDPADNPGEETSAERICWQCGETFSAELEYCPEDGNQLVELDPSDTKDILVGKVFDYRFRILRKLGEGGMSRVYSARRLDEEGEVALKVLKADFLRNPDVRKRFMYEARVISNLEHDNAVDLFDFGQAPDGSFYMVMELLEGESLADRLDGGALSYREIFAVVPSICEVLAEAHEQDVIHRDLKPENIFLTDTDAELPTAKLLDFGIAKHLRSRTMTKNDQLWGTPAYMSPEQASGDPVAGTADIYATGVMLYELVTGVLPFRASTAMGFAVKHMHREAPSMTTVPGFDEVPLRLEEFVQEMLAKSPSDRPENMQVVADELRGIRRTLFDEELLDSAPSLQTDYEAIEAPSDEEISADEMPVDTADGVTTVTGEEPVSEVSGSGIEAGTDREMPETPARGSAGEVEKFETPVFESGTTLEEVLPESITPVRLAVGAAAIVVLVGGVYLFTVGDSAAPPAESEQARTTADSGAQDDEARRPEPRRATSAAAGVAAGVTLRARTVASDAGSDETSDSAGSTTESGARERPAGGARSPARGASGSREGSGNDEGLSDEKTKEAVESTF